MVNHAKSAEVGSRLLLQRQSAPATAWPTARTFAWLTRRRVGSPRAQPGTTRTSPG